MAPELRYSFVQPKECKKDVWLMISTNSSQNMCATNPCFCLPVIIRFRARPELVGQPALATASSSTARHILLWSIGRRWTLSEECCRSIVWGPAFPSETKEHCGWINIWNTPSYRYWNIAVYCIERWFAILFVGTYCPIFFLGCYPPVTNDGNRKPSLYGELSHIETSIWKVFSIATFDYRTARG